MAMAASPLLCLLTAELGLSLFQNLASGDGTGLSPPIDTERRTGRS